MARKSVRVLDSRRSSPIFVSGSHFDSGSSSRPYGVPALAGFRRFSRANRLKPGLHTVKMRTAEFLSNGLDDRFLVTIHCSLFDNTNYERPNSIPMHSSWP